MHWVLRTALLTLFILVPVFGCGTAPPPGAKTATTNQQGMQNEDEDENRPNMYVVHAGRDHACLTAEILNTGGVKLIMLFETHDRPITPVTVAMDKIPAKAVRLEDGKEFDLVFKPAPETSRPPGEAAGTSSRFECVLAELKPDDKITVSTEVQIAKRTRKVRWGNFVPSRFASPNPND
jgi:hypothetical protein